MASPQLLTPINNASILANVELVQGCTYFLVSETENDSKGGSVMNLKPINVRHMEKRDVEAIIRCERMSHGVNFTIPELPQLGEIETLQPWAWRQDDVIKTIRQYRNKDDSAFDTRALVAEVPVTLLDPDHIPFEVYATVGGCLYELQEDGYEILLLTVQPRLTLPEVEDGATYVRRTLLEEMLKRAERSPKRTKVSIYIQDGDWETLKFFRKLGWAAKLHPYFYQDGNDAWYCEYQAAAEDKHVSRTNTH